MKKTKLSVLAALLFFGVVATSQGAALTSESIITNPVSTENLWEYSSFSDSSISNTNFYTASSQYSSAVFEGYLTGNGTRPNLDHFADTTSNFSKTSRVFTTYIRSAIDQTVRFGMGGDDGHSMFLDDGFLVGGGFGVNISHIFDMVANQSYELTTVGNNNGGGFELLFSIAGDLDDSTGQYGWAGPVSNAQSISMDAAGNFAAVPVPGAIWLLGSALLGLAGVSRRKKLL